MLEKTEGTNKHGRQYRETDNIGVSHDTTQANQNKTHRIKKNEQHRPYQKPALNLCAREG